MAIDTPIKRNSALLEPGNMPWPPDGSLATAPDRLAMLEFYSGIAAGSSVALTRPLLIAALGYYQSGAKALSGVSG